MSGPSVLIDWRATEAALSELVGRPYAPGARGPAAFDCWGLVLEVRRRLGLPLPPDFAHATPAEIRAAYASPRPAGWARGPLTRGAIVLAPAAGHAGVHLGGRVLHAVARAGVVAWTLGHWAATFGDVQAWERVPP